jgi:toxin-antitoxin system PIN domain toxin
VILPDVNLIVYAHNLDAPGHAAARAWWEELLNGDRSVAIAWVVALGFIRLMTSRVVLEAPLPPARAVACVRAWLAQPNVAVLDPGPRHLDILDQLFMAAGAAATLTTDAHLAALAIEHQCELHSNDADYARFPGLRWRNPLVSR